MTPFTLVAGSFITTGGMDRANYALADYLARSGRPVSLVSHKIDLKLATYPNVTFHYVPKPLGSDFVGSWPLSWVGRQVARKKGGRVVANGGNCLTVDVNWVHYVHSAYRAAHQLGYARRFKAALQQPLDRSAERAALLAARVVVCNSDRTRCDVIQLGVRPDRTAIVYLACDGERFRPASASEREELRHHLGWPKDRPIVIFIGALSDRRKGFDTLFAAWMELCSSLAWDAILVVVGRGAELPAWKSRAESSRLTDRIQFLGFREDVHEILRAADLLVSPTRYESYGLGVHEAICCGLPAIVSADAGVAELYSPEMAGLLLPDPDDIGHLVEVLDYWRSNINTWRHVTLNTMATVRQRTWDDCSRDFLTAIGELTQ